MSSDKKADDSGEGKKKGKGMLFKLIIGAVLMAAGGGGVFGAMQAGLIGEKHEEEDNKPKLVRKGEEDPYAPPTTAKEGEGAPEVFGDGGSEYRTLYFSFAEDFTSNLKNSQALIQVSLAASTRHDGRVIMWMKKHELAIRSAMLAVLASTPEMQLQTMEGKEVLQEQLTQAINKVLTEREGFGGVDSVYFKSLIVQ